MHILDNKFLVLLVLCLTACAEPKNTQQDETPQPQADWSQAANDGPSATEPNVVEEVAAEPTDQLPANLTKPALNLTLPADDPARSVEESDANGPIEASNRATLPNLFETRPTKDKDKIAVGAKVIHNPNWLKDKNPDKQYSDSIQGAEIKIEMQTGKKRSED